MDPERLSEIAKIGIAGFWGIVKKNFPHVRQDVIDPTLAKQLAAAAEQAVLNWGRNNDRDEWTEIGSVVRVTFQDSANKERPLAVTWDSDHNTFRTWAEVRPLLWEDRHYAPGYPLADPGLVRLEFDPDLSAWFWITEDRQRLAIDVQFQRGANAKSARLDPADRQVMVISEVLPNTEPELMRIQLPENFEQAMLVRNSIRRLVGELNMVYHALSLE